MRHRPTAAGAAILEGLLVVALIGAVVFGVVRTVFSPALLGNNLPDVVRDLGEDVFGPRYFGEAPSVRARLAVVHLTTQPPLYYYGAGEVPNGRGEFSGPFEAQVNAYSPSAGQKAGLVGSELLQGLATILVVVLLLRIVRTLRRGDPFVAENASRLRLIAMAVVIGGMGGALLRAWGEHLVLSDRVIAPLVTEETRLSFTPLAAALGIWLLAEVFRRGARLRHDVEGLV